LRIEDKQTYDAERGKYAKWQIRGLEQYPLYPIGQSCRKREILHGFSGAPLL